MTLKQVQYKPNHPRTSGTENRKYGLGANWNWIGIYWKSNTKNTIFVMLVIQVRHMYLKL